MDLFDAIASRHSYRGPYLPDAVPREDLVRIMEAGLAAPSGCNKQTTSLIAIDDPALLAQVRACIDPPLKRENAPAAICVLTQRINAYRDRCFCVQDYAAAIENMLLAIAALGYASCWYEGHITDDDRLCDKMAAVLGVPEGYDLVCYLPVGRPDRTVRGVAKTPSTSAPGSTDFPPTHNGTVPPHHPRGVPFAQRGYSLLIKRGTPLCAKGTPLPNARPPQRRPCPERR